MASSSSSPWNQQVPRQQNRYLYNVDWVHELDHSTILEESIFHSFFSVFDKPTIDIVVFSEEETNSPYGFGFVANEESSIIGGTFGTHADTDTRLRDQLFIVAEVLRDILTGYHHSQRHHVGDLGHTKLVNYVRFRNPSRLLERQVSNYFNTFPPCNFSAVALFKDSPCGFGFLQIDPTVEGNYWVRIGMVETLKMIIADGIRMTHSVQQQQHRGERGRGFAASEVPQISASFLGQGVIGSRMTYTVQQQQQRGERGKGSAASEVPQISASFLSQGVNGSRMTYTVQQQHRGERGRGSAASEELFNTALNTICFRPIAEVSTHYPTLNTPSGAHLWTGSQTAPSYAFGSAEVTGQSLSRSLSGGHPNPFEWPHC